MCSHVPDQPTLGPSSTETTQSIACPRMSDGGPKSSVRVVAPSPSLGPHVRCDSCLPGLLRARGRRLRQLGVELPGHILTLFRTGLWSCLQPARDVLRTPGSSDWSFRRLPGDSHGFLETSGDVPRAEAFWRLPTRSEIIPRRFVHPSRDVLVVPSGLSGAFWRRPKSPPELSGAFRTVPGVPSSLLEFSGSSRNYWSPNCLELSGACPETSRDSYSF